MFEQVPVPDHPGGGTCPPGDGPEWGGVTLVGCHLGLDGFGRAVADGVLDHLGDEVAAIGGGQLVAVQEVAQLGGAGGGIGQVLALGDVVVVELRVQLGGGGDLVEPVGRPAVGQSMKATGRPSRATMFQGPVSR